MSEMVYLLKELNIGQSFWFNGEQFKLLDGHIFRGCMRCARKDGVIFSLKKDAVVVPEFFQASLF